MSGGFFEAFEGLNQLAESSSDLDDTGFLDNFSQVLAQADSTTQQPSTAPSQQPKRRPRKDFKSFHRAALLTQSLLQDAKERSQSRTALRAFLLVLKDGDRMKRFRDDLMWPAHVDDFAKNRLVHASEEPRSSHSDEPFFAFGKSERLKQKEKIVKVSGKGPDYRISTESFNESDVEDDKEDSKSDNDSNAVPLQMSQSRRLQAALERTVKSIWRSKKPRDAAECNQRTCYAIARRCALMLEVLFEQVILNRKNALKIIKGTRGSRPGVDSIDAVPSNWEAVSAAMKRLNGQVCLDDEIQELFLRKLRALNCRKI